MAKVANILWNLLSLIRNYLRLTVFMIGLDLISLIQLILCKGTNFKLGVPVENWYHILGNANWLK